MTIRHDRIRSSRLADARLYLIASPPVTPLAETRRAFVALVAAAVRGGVGIVQLRAKGAPTEDVVRLAMELKPVLGFALFLINDDIEAARQSAADGVHLGQDDAKLAVARDRLGSEALVGVSTHSLEQAIAGERDGADYLGFGAMFDTATKAQIELVGPSALSPVVARVKIPVFAIGGITARNVLDVIRCGGHRIAVSKAILEAVDPESAARELLELLS